MKHWEILVVDDSARFPLHVWRYFTGCLGFGIGEVGADGFWRGPSGSEARPWISEGPLLTEDGYHRIWWVSADDQALQKIGNIFGRFDLHSHVYALVDVHGRRGYRVEDVCSYVRSPERIPKCEMFLVSSYHSGHRLTVDGKPLPVLAKSRETLRRIVREIGVNQKAATVPPGVRHILVTGAGFEIQGNRGGFGMPPTHRILLEMGAPLDPQDLGLTPPDPTCEDAFPIPTSERWRIAGERFVLKRVALARELDTYWDWLLEQELRHILGSMLLIDTPEDRDNSKAQALWRERCLREAFRRSLLRHDWGYMNQSLDAAQMPLHAWLTTNYTQFADRAISLFGDAEEDLGMWRTISTSAESRTLTRQGIGSADQKVRYLFKLHGDIAHLQTMAIAGHDKDRFSPLTMPVDDLYEVYAGAERFLIDSLRAAKPVLVVWHIVGHGLKDRRLCALLAWVYSHVPDETDQIFVVINPQPSEPLDLLKRSLVAGQPGSKSLPIYCGHLRAAEYMSRLLQFSRGNEEDIGGVCQVEDVRRWLEIALTQVYL
jgi:hypothetical protein